MDAEKTALGEAQAILQLRAIQEAKLVRQIYESTGRLVPRKDCGPHLSIAWSAAECAVRYALPLAGTVERLPKTFNWLGIPYRLIFPDQGVVQIEDPSLGLNLCVGLQDGFDPKSAEPKAKA